MNLPMATELLTVLDVARRLRVGSRTVWRWCATGHMPAPLRLGKSGRTVRWRAVDIERFLEEQVSSPGPVLYSTR